MIHHDSKAVSSHAVSTQWTHKLVSWKAVSRRRTTRQDIDPAASVETLKVTESIPSAPRENKSIRWVRKGK